LRASLIDPFGASIQARYEGRGRKISGIEARPQKSIIDEGTMSNQETSGNTVGANDQSANYAPDEFPAPIGRLIGFKLGHAVDGQATIEFEATERHANPMGTLHGGVLCDIADAAMGFAYRSTLAAGETFTTLELKINFLRPVWKAKLRAKARMVRAGQTVGLVECDIVDERERLVARASSTCMTLRGHDAAGR
jgi:uncharacterized protein (TIGR00369 family)